MADKVANGRTSLSTDEVLVRAVQYFSTEKFKVTSQSARTVTFEGRPPIPWGLMFGTILGYIFCVVPGIVMHFMFIRKLYRFYSLIVAVSPIEGGTEVSVTFPDFAGLLVPRFLSLLEPQIAVDPAGAPA